MISANAIFLRLSNGLRSFIKQKGWWPILILFPIFISMLPVLVGGEIYANGDLIVYHYPVYHFYKSAILTFGSFLWNPYNFSGFPTFIGSMGFFSPVHFLIFYFLPVFTAYNILLLLSLSLAGWLMWRFLDRLGISFYAGYLGSLVYVFGQWQWSHDLAVITALPVLPFIFLLLWDLQAKTKKTRIIFLGGVIIGWCWFAVHFNWLFMILSAAGLFAIYLDGRSLFKIKQSITFSLLLMVALGFSLGSAIILPLSNYSELSARSNGITYVEAGVNSLMPGDFVRYILPYFRTDIFHFASSPAQLYLGVIPLFLVILAISFRKSIRGFFSWLFLGGLLTAISYSPIFWLLHQVPVFSSFRGPDRWLFVVSFAAGVLSAFGFDQLISLSASRRVEGLLKFFKWLTILTITTVLGLSLFFAMFKNKLIFLANFYFDNYFYEKTSQLPSSHYHSLIEKLIDGFSYQLNFINPAVFIPLIFLLVSYLFLRFILQKEKPMIEVSLALVLLVVLNFIFVFYPYHPTMDKKVYDIEPDTVSFLKQRIAIQGNLEANRIFSFLPGFSEYNKLTVPFNPSQEDSFRFQTELLTPNINLWHNMPSVDYYDNLMSRRMGRVLALTGSDRSTSEGKLSEEKIVLDEKISKFEDRKFLLDILGVRYILSVYPMDENKFEKIYFSSAPPYDVPINIYENKNARPLAYLAGKILKVLPIDEEAAFEFLLTNELKNNEIFIECDNCPNDFSSGNNGSLSLVEGKNGSWELKTVSTSSEWLVVTENYLPGWEAFIDDEPVPAYMVNSIHLGVFVPPGEHVVKLKYSYKGLFFK